MSLDQDTNTPGSVTSNFIFETSARYTHPVITSSPQNNIVVSSIENYTVLIFTSTVDVNITGISSAGVNDYQMYVIVNNNVLGGKHLKLKKNDAGSLAANRFAFHNDMQIDAGEIYIILYSSAAQRWFGFMKP